MVTPSPRANRILPDDGGQATVWQIELESRKAVKTREYRPGSRLAALRSDWLLPIMKPHWPAGSSDMETQGYAY